MLATSFLDHAVCASCAGRVQRMGRRGGARVIFYVRTARGDLVLVTAYTKGRIENIPAHLLRALVEKYDV